MKNMPIFKSFNPLRGPRPTMIKGVGPQGPGGGRPQGGTRATVGTSNIGIGVLDAEPAQPEAVDTKPYVEIDPVDAPGDAFEIPEAAPLPAVASPSPFERQYEIIRPLGKGGQGTAVLIRDRRHDTLHVAKVTSNVDLETRRKVEREVAALVDRGLVHPNVVHATKVMTKPSGYGYDDLLLITDYVSGQDLGLTVAHGKKLTEEQLWSIGEQIGSALQAIHEAGVVHRDLKPANVIQQPDGQVTLIDFGIAKLANQETGATSMGKYTLFYAAPEQLQLGKVGPHTDIYALGLLLLTLAQRKPRDNDVLTGPDPFTQVDALQKEGYSKAFCDYLRAMLHRDPQLREIVARAPAAAEPEVQIVEKIVERVVEVPAQPSRRGFLAFLAGAATAAGVFKGPTLVSTVAEWIEGHPIPADARYRRQELEARATSAINGYGYLLRIALAYERKGEPGQAIRVWKYITDDVLDEFGDSSRNGILKQATYEVLRLGDSGLARKLFNQIDPDPGTSFSGDHGKELELLEKWIEFLTNRVTHLQLPPVHESRRSFYQFLRDNYPGPKSDLPEELPQDLIF